MSKLISRMVPAYVNDGTNSPSIAKFAAIALTPQQVGSTSGLNLYGYNLYNPNATDVFFKFFDSTIVPVFGVNDPSFTLQVPALGSVVLIGTDVFRRFTNDMYVGASLLYPDADATAIPIGVFTFIIYK